MRRWRHRAGDRYVLITTSVVGGPDHFRVERYLGTGEFASIREARRVGFRDLYRSDDFNIGAIRHGGLAAILWMTEIVDDDEDLMFRIAEEVGLAAA